MGNRCLFIICAIMFFSFSNTLFGQNAHFPAEGVIEFEKSVNMHAQIIKMIGNGGSNQYLLPELERYKVNEPQFEVLKSRLYFSKDKTLFVPEESRTRRNMFYSIIPAAKQLNIFYNNLAELTAVVQKGVFEEIFLLKDATRKINWKITGDTREIIGFNCRRANAIIMDSIYVVAFYTEDIPISGGPESFSGLPGMILAVVLPHENVNWFAKSIVERRLEKDIIIPPTKGKAINSKQLYDFINLVDLGPMRQELLKYLLL